MTSSYDPLPDFMRGRNLLIYDGECPFCSRYVALIKIREAVGKLHLLDARDRHGERKWLQEQGVDLDEGMVLVLDDKIYHGDAALNMLARLSTDSGVFNRLNRWLFGASSWSRALYPWMRSGRNAVLRILGRSKLKNL